MRELGDEALAQLVDKQQAVPVLFQEGDSVRLLLVEGRRLVDLLKDLLGEAGVSDGRVGHPHGLTVVLGIGLCTHQPDSWDICTAHTPEYVCS